MTQIRKYAESASSRLL